MKIKLIKPFWFKKRFITNLMRTFILLFCTAVFSSTPTDLFSQNEKIVVDMDRTITVDEVFEMIKSQTDYNFIYQEDLFKNAPSVRLTKGKIKLNRLLKMSLSNGNYQIGFDKNDNIFIKPKVLVAAQNDVLIKGIVTDANNIPISGVTVTYKQFPNRSIASDFDGVYQILVNEGGNATLQFSSIGYITQELTVGDRTTINVVMQESNTTLNEVVVVGYGTVKRKDLTGSVGTLKAKDLATTPTATSFDQLLGGKLSGVSVMQSSGAPGKMSIVNIRGLSALRGDNQPLYVIDGVPVVTQDVTPSSFPGSNTNAFVFGSNPLLAINPNDIESIDVLKDASAASIYGSRAANGVIIVTTKRGKKNQAAQINFDYSTSITTPTKNHNWMNAEQFREYQTLLAQNTLDAAAAGNWYAPFFSRQINTVLNDERVRAPWLPQPPAGTPYFGDKDTDWQDVYSNSAPLVQKFNLSTTGGSEVAAYSLAAYITSAKGTYIGNKLNSYGLRASIDVDAKDWFSLGGTFNYSINKNNGTALNTSSLVSSNPTIGPGDRVVNYFSIVDTNAPGSQVLDTNESKSSNVIGNVYGKLRPIKNLEFKTELAFSLSNSERIAIGAASNAFADRGGWRQVMNNKTDNTTLTNTLTYNNTFVDKHNVNTVVGNAWDIRNISSRAVGFLGFPDEFTNSFPGPNIELQLTNEGVQQSFLNSYFGRVNYDFDSRYYLTLSGRFDGSDKFGINNQWGFFPAVAAAWRISNEAFLENSEVLNELKLRASIGRTGNNTLEGFQDTFLYGTDPGFGIGSTYNGINGLVNLVLPNPDVKWETTDQLDVALEFGLFKSRLNGSIGYYSKDTKDLLAFGKVPLQRSFATQIRNVARIENSGWEFELNGDIIRAHDFNWNSSFNISFNDNVLKELNDASIFSNFNPDEFVVGEPLGSISGYVVEGVIRDQAEADALNAAALASGNGLYAGSFVAVEGSYKYKDGNNDGVITSEDREVLGNSSVDYFGGWSNTLTYKGFNLYFDFQFSGGNEREYGFNTWIKHSGFGGLTTDKNNVVEVLDNTWTPDNRDAKYERLIFGFPDFLLDGKKSINVYDASYVRFKTLRFGYDLPSSLIDKIGISGLNISLTATNLATWTDWPGLDPESVTGNGGISGSVKTHWPYPLTSTYSLGLNVKF